MDAIALLREQLTEAHAYLEAIMRDVTPEQAHWDPPGTANPVGATYAHLVLFEDRTINGILLRRKPLYETEWEGKTGISDLTSAFGAVSGEGQDYVAWTRKMRVDLPALRQYAQAVYANTDEYLASLSPDDLNRPLDLRGVGGGMVTLGHALSRRILAHVDNISGEISCLKGLQGLQGYPA